MEKTADKKEFTVLELAYISKFHEFDGIPSIAMAMDRCYQSTYQIVKKMKNEGSLEHYKKIWDMQFRV